MSESHTVHILESLRLFTSCPEFTTLLVFSTVFLLLYFTLSKRQTNIPGPMALPVIGNVVDLVRMRQQTRRGGVFTDFAKKYGDIFRLYFGPQLVVVCCSHDVIHKAFVKYGDKTSDRPNWIPPIREMTKNGKGIIWQNGDEWKSIRRFTLQTMRDFGVGKVTIEERILEEANALCAIFEDRKGQEIDVKRMLTVAISNVIHNVVFGFRYGHDDEKFTEILDCFDRLFRNPPTFFSPIAFLPWLRFFIRDDRKDIIEPRDRVLSYISEQIEEHKSSYDENNIRDFVDLYIKAENEECADKNVYNKGNIFRAILDLFAAGTETTASTLNWSLLYMIAYPDVQKKCQQEIDRVVGHGRMVRLSDRSDLKYVEATLMEIQRISNIASGSLPHQTSEDINLDGYHIPKGTILIASLRSSHLDPRRWEEPESFNPVRFLGNNGKIINKDNLIPFSIGPRICLGESLAKMEMYVIFVNLLQRFTFTKVSEDQVLDFNGLTGVTTVPAPYSLKAIPR